MKLAFYLTKGTQENVLFINIPKHLLTKAFSASTWWHSNSFQRSSSCPESLQPTDFTYPGLSFLYFGHAVSWLLSLSWSVFLCSLVPLSCYPSLSLFLSLLSWPGSFCWTWSVYCFLPYSGLFQMPLTAPSLLSKIKVSSTILWTVMFLVHLNSFFPFYNLS